MGDPEPGAAGGEADPAGAGDEQDGGGVPDWDGVFGDLVPPIQELLGEEGWTGPTRSQQAAIPPILEGRHALLTAPTGTGKTEAAILPIFDELLRWREEAGDDAEDGFHVIYVTPLRALNRDLLDRLEAWGETLGIDVSVRHGDTTDYERRKQVEDPPDMLITTPETCQLLFTGHRLRDQLPAAKWVVVDEIHELAASERGAQLAVALERLAEYAGEFQRVGLSATVGDEEAVARFLGGPGRDVETLHVPVATELDVDVRSPYPTDEDEEASHELACSGQAAAYVRRALDLVEDHEGTLLFVNTRERAEVLAARARMLDRDVPVAVHHGSLAKDARLEAEDGFREGRIKGLICTSSMELGIDIGHADLVLQYNSPRQVMRLVQRVGRAGHRADIVSNGTVVSTDPDDVAESLVIVDRTLEGEIEHVPGPVAPLDVLANQLAAMTLERDDPDGDWAYEVVTRSEPFRDLDRGTFDEVLEVLSDQYVVWTESTTFSSGSRSHGYFFDNISMIPDEQTFRIEDLTSGNTVATLDESFVASFVEPGASFICQGQAWKVAEIDDDENLVRVRHVANPIGAVPSWVGEEIPVPYEVAQEVGALRRRLARRIEEVGVDAAADELAGERPVDEDGARKLATFVASQGEHVLPTDETWTLEHGSERTVLNAPLGHQVNETLGRLVSSMLTARAGTTVGLDIDPYRVILTLPSSLGPGDVLDVLHDTPPESLEELLRIVLQDSQDLRHRLVHAAKKFGALDHDADWRKVDIDRLLEVYKETPIYREAVREVLVEKLDVENAREALEALQEGAIDVEVQGMSPVGEAGIEDRIELVTPARAHRRLLDAMRDRLDDERVTLLCLHCRDWKARTVVERAGDRLRCPECGARLVGVTRPWREEVVAAWEKDPDARSAEEEREWKKLRTSANLVMSHGERALRALVARGVGPETAGRILMRQRDDEIEFLRDLLEAEVTYARTREFWD